MPLNDAQIKNGYDAIFAAASDSQVTETAEWIKAGEENPVGEFVVFRTKELRSEEIQFTGFSKEYQFSVFAKAIEAGNGNGNFIAEGDKLQMSGGFDDASADETTIFRIHKLTMQPGRHLVRIDLGDEFEAQ